MTHLQTNTKGRCVMHPVGEVKSKREPTPREELDDFAAEMSQLAEDTQELGHRRQSEAEALFARSEAARAAADSARVWLNDATVTKAVGPKTVDKVLE